MISFTMFHQKIVQSEWIFQTKHVEINEDHGEITTNCKLTRTPPKQQTQEIAPRRFPPIDLHEKKKHFWYSVDEEANGK